MNVGQRCETPPGRPASVAWSAACVEVTEMLATLGFNLVFAVFVCSMILFICWAYDTANAGVEARRSLAAGAKLAVAHYPLGYPAQLRAPQLSATNGVHGATPISAARWRLQRGAGVTSQFHLVLDLENGHDRDPRH
jgi:hypothetical protein